MKNLLFIIALINFSFASEAQTKATPLSFHGVDVYAMMTPVQAYEVVGVATFKTSKSALSNTEWLDLAMQQSPVQKFDAIVTRNGLNIQYIRYKNNQGANTGILTNLKGEEFETYYFSSPTKKYTVVSKQALAKTVSSASFYDIMGDLWLRNFKLKYDAIIVGEDEAQYILYNL